MGDVFDDYYAKLIADGKLEATDCSISISPTEYSCYKNGQQWYAYNDIAYGASVSFNKWQ
jgi:hypothetical protein